MFNKDPLKIYSEKLLGLTKLSDSCDAELISTGVMYYDAVWSGWVIEYLCQSDNLAVNIWSADRDTLIREIVQEVLGDDWQARLMEKEKGGP